MHGDIILGPTMPLGVLAILYGGIVLHGIFGESLGILRTPGSPCLRE